MSGGVHAQVVEFIMNNYLFGDESSLPGDGDSLLETGVIDSTGVLELVDFLETDLGIEVADHETVPENLDSIANIVAYIGRKQA